MKIVASIQNHGGRTTLGIRDNTDFIVASDSLLDKTQTELMNFLDDEIPKVKTPRPVNKRMKMLLVWDPPAADAGSRSSLFSKKHKVVSVTAMMKILDYFDSTTSVEWHLSRDATGKLWNMTKKNSFMIVTSRKKVISG